VISLRTLALSPFTQTHTHTLSRALTLTLSESECMRERKRERKRERNKKERERREIEIFTRGPFMFISLSSLPHAVYLFNLLSRLLPNSLACYPTRLPATQLAHSRQLTRPLALLPNSLTLASQFAHLPCYPTRSLALLPNSLTCPATQLAHLPCYPTRSLVRVGSCYVGIMNVVRLRVVMSVL
jgi:hypothetical protein